VIGRVASVSSQRTRNRRVMVNAELRDATGSCADLLQPAVAGAAALGPRRHPRGHVRQGRDLPRPSPDDQPGGRPGRRPHRPDRARLPPVGEGPHHHLGDRRVGGRGAAACRRPGRPGARPRCSTARPGRHAPRRSAWSTPRRQRRGLHGCSQAAHVRRAAAAPAGPGPAQAPAGAHPPSASPTTPGGPELLRRFHDRSCRTRSPARSSGSSTRSSPTSPARAHAPAAAGRRRCRQDVVAVSAMLVAVQGGHQGALMAPTEVLAEQHALGIRELLADLRCSDDTACSGSGPCGWSCSPTAHRRGSGARWPEGLADGDVDLVIGTHALIQDDGGLRVARRGGRRRAAPLRRRAAGRAAGQGAEGSVPDVLVMTATPIPRTAAMTVYGDLDVSVLDELPPGRTPIETTWARTEAEQDRGVEPGAGRGRRRSAGLRGLPAGRGVREARGASAEETYEQLVGGELAGLRLGLLHGRVPAGQGG
jgi:hypothetical protein